MTTDEEPQSKYPRWTDEQLTVLEKYFTTQMTMVTLYQRLCQLQPVHTFEGVCHQVRRWRDKGFMKPREDAVSRLRRGFLDIETTHLKGNFGIMLCYYIKPENEEDVAKYSSGIITRREMRNARFDKRIVTKLLKDLKNYDEVWTHYGRRFDVPFVNTRSLIWGLGEYLPQPGTKFLKDTWEIARKMLALHSNRLDAIAEALGVTEAEKTRLKPRTWQNAMYGDEEAIKYIAEHCVADVQLLEAVYHRLRPLDRTPLRSM